MSLQLLKNYFKLMEQTNLHELEYKRIAKLHTEYLIHIVEKLELEKVPEQENTEPFISLMEFYVETHICHPNSISKLLTGDPEFLRVCGKRQGKKYYVKLESTIKYLASCDSPKLSNSARRFLKKRDETQEKICPIPNQLPLLQLPIN